MSAVYKVLEQMQKTRPRRIRGNREVMTVLGGIVIVGMLMLVSSLNNRLKADNQRDRQAQEKLKVGAIDGVGTIQGSPLIINISLNEQNQWVVEDRGVVTKDELLEIFAAKRALANEQGVLSIVRAQIDGEQPAKHFLELHRLAEQCDMDQVNVVTSEPLLGEGNDGNDEDA